MKVAYKWLIGIAGCTLLAWVVLAMLDCRRSEYDQQMNRRFRLGVLVAVTELVKSSGDCPTADEIRMHPSGKWAISDRNVSLTVSRVDGGCEVLANCDEAAPFRMRLTVSSQSEPRFRWESVLQSEESEGR